ncbi:AAA family ATPase [Ruminococcus sp.]|uniref:AAA family ATPase n=1 Tax=Ruminococcus sp. TaxID=41978 RepID=UPI0025F50956|nr:AAA family ATPase [Ruminococcus sp.]MBQ9540844.1 AAA family ATPase [Ruminococcus sp.]
MDILSAKGEKDYDRIIEAGACMRPEACSSKSEAHAIGKAYEKKCAFGQCLEWYMRSYELGGSDEELGMIAGVCLACGKYDELRSFLDNGNADPDGYYYRAARYELALRTGGSAEEQIQALENFIDVQYEESYMLRLASLYLEQGSDKAAGKLCKKIMRLYIDTDGALYAKDLADAIKAGEGLAFVHEKAWLKDKVFKHISFDLSAKPMEDIRIGRAAVSTEKPMNANRVTVSEEKPKTEGGEGRKLPLFGKKSADKTAKKDRISPIVEKSMKNVVGMGELKTALNDIVNVLQTEKKRAGTEAIILNNIKILGPDGCGKTTAAYAACRTLNALGISAFDEPVVTDYDSLLTDDNEELHSRIQELFDNAMGGCLLIENIHEFDDENGHGVGSKILDQIYSAIKSANGGVTLIITGREKETEDLLLKKPKIAALFNLRTVVLGKYSTDDLMVITDKLAESKSLVINDAAKLVLRKKLENMASQPDFTYSKDLERILTEAYVSMSNRLSKKRRAAGDDYYVITEEDINSGESAETVEELLDKLKAMTGLASVKESVQTVVNQVKVNKMRAEQGIAAASNGTLHMVFTGNAGTGKTTVARIIGKIYRRLGVLPKGHFVECTRKDLISSIYGKTAQQVSEKVKEAMGGILFIDEAYSLCRDDNDTYGKEAIETLLTEMENHRDSIMVIIAGYGPEMDKFLDKNQGLRSRMSNTINFEDYTADEMVSIFKSMVSAQKFMLDVGTDKDIRDVIEARASKKDFGNARGVRNVLDDVIKQQANRLADGQEHSRNDFLIIKKEDIAALKGSRDSGGDEGKTADDYVRELEELTGLGSVKAQVRALVASAKVNQRLAQLNRKTQGFGTLHMVFKGNAGTGKTTVARIIGNIYHSLGALSKGQLVECNRSNLVAGYVGQTAARTREKVEEALGGVLFIDEAYSLAQGGENDFGREAINELVAQVENHRNDLCVIIAGYSKDMDEFLATNQGLSSRFTNEIVFEDYTPAEMLEILKKTAAADGNCFEDGIDGLLTELLAQKSAAADFGNARGVRNVAGALKSKKDMRAIEYLDSHQITDMAETERLLTTITAEDVMALMNER